MLFRLKACIYPNQATAAPNPRSIRSSPYLDEFALKVYSRDILPRLLQRSKECRGHYSTLYHATLQWIIRILLTQC